MLNELIEKLSQAEKRYFTLRANLFKNSPDHYHLFRFIETTKDASLDNLKAFDKDATKTNLALKKRYLKVSLLEALRNFHHEQSIGSVIMNHIQDAEVFYNKLMFRECLRSLNRAKKLCIDQERFGLHLEVLNWQRRLIGSTMEAYDISEEMIDAEEREVHKNNAEEMQMRRLQAQVFEFKKKYGYLDESKTRIFSAIFSESDFTQDLYLRSNRAQFYYLWARSIYYSLITDYEKSYQMTKQINMNFFKVVDPEDLYFGMLEHLTSCMYSHRYEETLSQLEKLKELKKIPAFSNKIAIEERFFYYHSNYKLISLISMGKEKEGIEYIQRLIPELESRKNPISKTMLTVINGSIAQCAFALGLYPESKRICQSVLNNPISNVRQDVYASMRLLYPFILLELKQYKLMTSSVTSAKNYFSKDALLHKYEDAIVLKIQSFIEGRLTKKELAIALQNISEEHFSGDFRKVVFDIRILIFWAKSIINRSKIMEEFHDWSHQSC